MPLDLLVDRFVAAVNMGYREPVNIEIHEVPPSVLVGEPYEDGWSDWAIKPRSWSMWIESVEERLGRSFPAVYRSLVTRYVFPSFEAGDVLFFANTPEGTELRELRSRLFSEDLSPPLLRSGYIQIGQPAGESYDPVCFAPYAEDATDGPLVRIDHEGIIQGDVVEVMAEVAPSLRHLMNSVIEAAGLRPYGE